MTSPIGSVAVVVGDDPNALLAVATIRSTPVCPTCRWRKRPDEDYRDGVAEAGFLLDRELVRHIEWMLHDNIMAEHLAIDDWERTAELVSRCEAFPDNRTDASLVARAEKHEQSELATFGHRHFAVVRPAPVNAFTLLP